ncbi:MAG: helix-turn-helix domain-containing protein [Candidatus Gastranaerophilales bacterium]|nr:helix-turn-helix domain-containing protein [Candidatus Gastranaerophilales bacterium]
MQDIRTLVGSLIKKKRKLLKLTQSELACKVGVDPKYISRIETGTSYPSLSVVEKIFGILNIDIESVLIGKDNLDKETMINIINIYLQNTSLKNVKIVKNICDVLMLED